MSDDTTTRGTTDDLGTLVGDWLDWTACAKHLGVPVSKVRTWIREHQLAAAVPAEGAGQQVHLLAVAVHERAVDVEHEAFDVVKSHGATPRGRRPS